MRKIKVGIIGQGRSGRDIHRHLFETQPSLMERYDVVAVADPIPERCAPVNPGANPSCKIYSDYRDLLKDKNIELVINASRSHKHVDICIEAMEAGFDTISEKPLARHVSDVERVEAAAKKTGRFFTVFQQSRFRPLYRKVFDIMQSGILGKIVMFKVAYNGFGRRWDWQTIQDLCAGELLNTGPHPLDQAVEVWNSFGDCDPEKIFCSMARVNNFGDAEDHIKILFSGKDHPTIDFEVSRCIHYTPYTYQVYGSNGSLTALGNTIEWKYFIPSEAEPREVQLAPLEAPGRLPRYCGEKLGFYEEKFVVPESATGFDHWGSRYYENVYDAYVNGAELIVKLEQVKRQVRIIEECHRQNPLPKFVKVPAGTV